MPDHDREPFRTVADIPCHTCGLLPVIQAISGAPRAIDACIAPVVSALNASGARTIGSCCGHGWRPGNVILADGREVIIVPDYESARQIDRLFPFDIHGRAGEPGRPTFRQLWQARCWSLGGLRP